MEELPEGKNGLRYFLSLTANLRTSRPIIMPTTHQYSTSLSVRRLPRRAISDVHCICHTQALEGPLVKIPAPSLPLAWRCEAWLDDGMILVWGALFGFISVAFGAYSEHNLRETVSDEHFRSLMTAVRYNQVNAVIICAIGLALHLSGKLSQIRPLKWSAQTFLLGTILFSFGIYLWVLLDVQALRYLAPIGGIVTMIAWVLLLAAGGQARPNKDANDST